MARIRSKLVTKSDKLPPKKCLSKEFLWDLAVNPKRLNIACLSLLLVEAVLNVFIINKVPYTEIDWVAYMQEVGGFLNGTLDYRYLKGDTGPLVYPAGFVYIYSALYYITSQGRNVHLAQYVFLGVYLAQLCCTFRIHCKTSKVSPLALAVATLTSYRIHSVYVLRLFNDPIAVLLFYIGLNAFISNRWRLGSFFFSLAVSVKMNILLYAPCLLVAYLTNLTFVETLVNLFVCAFVQLVLGLPFLYTNVSAYLRGSFDLGRIFEHKWTVNYRFLPRELFESRSFHVALLVLHLTLLVAFYPTFKKYLSSYARLDKVARDVSKDLKKKNERVDFDRKVQLLVLPFFVANLVGVACARSLHYQFYSWYFHSLLYLGYCSGYNKPFVFLILGLIEMCWNTYPSTVWSSAVLHVCHVLLIYGVYNYMKK